MATVYAKDMLALVEHLGLEQYSLAGYSMGAVTAMRMQQLGAFEQVKHYIHMDQSPVVKNRADWPWGLMAERQPAYLKRWGAMLEALNDFGTQRPFAELPAPLRQSIWVALSEFMQETFQKPAWRKLAIPLTKQDTIMKHALPSRNWAAYISCMAAYVQHSYDFIASMSEAETPVTIFSGRQSTMYPLAGQKAFQRSLKNSSLIEFPGCGHGLVFESPWTVSRALGKALDKF